MDTRAGNEKPAAELLAALLGEAGFAVRIKEHHRKRANLIARIGTGRPLTLTGHLDTVPADATGWSFDPLSRDIRGDLLLGRGSTDMKAGLACIVAAATEHASRFAGTAHNWSSPSVRRQAA
ncbi:M20/M25/M40 family metallo-hydrolase [Actinomadura sp. NAK00032]|uniref:M20/M25/M40 family metallo-hydrolase n=1 Tax=Actinomadura sp. NAK00032 TaxID=2742128 RepID=UPI001C379986|nr:M20/M25/M40 family metallo-hydrolase [Actinomadura sp. NAK00032]